MACHLSDTIFRSGSDKRKFTIVDTEASVKYLELLPLSVSVTKKSPESILPPKRIKRELNDATSSPNVTVKTLKRRLVIKRGTKNDVNDDGRRFNHFERHYDDSDGSGDESCFLIFFEICLVISRLGSKKTCRYSYFLSVVTRAFSKKIQLFNSYS